MAATSQYQPLFITCVFQSMTVSIFWEENTKKEEIVLYIIPRFLDLTWNYIKKKRWVQNDVPCFQEIVFALSIGVLCHYHINERDAQKSKYKMIGNLLVDVKLVKEKLPFEVELKSDCKDGQGGNMAAVGEYVQA